MKKEMYRLLEDHMISCMQDSAHDKEHIYRVLYNALNIAASESDVNYDVLIAACLLHDIARPEQHENPEICHALAGAEKAYVFLKNHGFEDTFVSHVKNCIATHRFRKSMQPESIEAKILFDADKLDVTGAIGIARTLLYQGAEAEPLYTMLPDGTVSDGSNDKIPSFFQEYKRKLEHIDQTMYTERARQIAAEKKRAADVFYRSLLEEVKSSYVGGKILLEERLR